MQGNIVAQGVELMVYGMGTVVVFLGLLVVATVFMSRLVARYFPEPESTPTVAEALRRLRGETSDGGSAEDAQLVAVIGAAIHRHRSRTK